MPSVLPAELKLRPQTLALSPRAYWVSCSATLPPEGGGKKPNSRIYYLFDWHSSHIVAIVFGTAVSLEQCDGVPLGFFVLGFWSVAQSSGWGLPLTSHPPPFQTLLVLTSAALLEWGVLSVACTKNPIHV